MLYMTTRLRKCASVLFSQSCVYTYCGFDPSILSAAAPSDYLSGPYTATFLSGSTSATVDIILVEDDIYEANIGTETFTASISAISAVGCSISAGPNRTATVSITDNEGMV